MDVYIVTFYNSSEFSSPQVFSRLDDAIGFAMSASTYKFLRWEPEGVFSIGENGEFYGTEHISLTGYDSSDHKIVRVEKSIVRA